jgi:hypothetical protein
MHEHLRQIGAMRLILRLGPNDLNGADDRSRGILSCEHHPLAARQAGCDAAPEGPRLRSGYRKHEADGSTAFHTIDKHVAPVAGFRDRRSLAEIGSGRRLAWDDAIPS